MKKIVVACGFEIDKEAIALLSEVAQVIVARDDSEAALLSEAGDADAILVGPRPYVRRDFIESARRLKHIARVGVGLDSIDMQARTERGIMVTNAPDVTADSVPSSPCHYCYHWPKYPRCDRAVREGRWNERFELSGSNIELRVKPMASLAWEG
jgi:D-3-phosphoglycerate dehydrogenase